MKTLLYRDNSGTQSIRYQPPSNPEGRIDLSVQTTFAAHRSGWSFALDALLPEHNDAGVLFDGFLDRTLNSQRGNRFAERFPYQRPWVGVLHAVAHVPAWFPKQAALQSMIAGAAFQESLPHCRGLFTLSETCAAYLRQQLAAPVSALIHPTETPAALFDHAAFLANPHKKIVAVGWWLRKLMSIDYLPLDERSPYRKQQLLNDSPAVTQTIRQFKRLAFVHDRDNRHVLADKYRDNTETLPYLPNAAYDELLSRNLVFLDLYDANANNAVVECIARGTPLLINPLPAVVEYLGIDYPFYFRSLDEAAAKALDFDLVEKTHVYLMRCPTRQKLSQEYFLRSFRASAVYQGLASATRARLTA